MNDRIYADHAATTFLSPTALEAMMPYLTGNFGNPSSIHSFGEDAATAISGARSTIADILNCDPEGIIFTSGGSEADNHAIQIIANYAVAESRNDLLVSGVEHHAVLSPATNLSHRGINTIKLDAGSDGVVSVESVHSAAESCGRICGGSFMLANNETGSIFDICSISEVIRENGGLMHSDAVQAVGHIPVDFQKLGVDMLSLSAHKFHGPKGIGALICRTDIPAISMIMGGSQERGLRAGTENVAGIVGMATALSESVENMKRDSEKVSELRAMLLEGLIPLGAIVNGSGLPGILSVRFPGGDGEATVRSLDLFGIAASAGAACNSKDVTASHVLLSMGMDETDAASTVRFSLDFSNNKEEIRHIINIMTDLLRN